MRSATRLLVLGVVRMYGRAHGYRVSNELESWFADEWANVLSGSIYHALRQLEREGLLRSTTVEKWPGRVDYELTEQGEAEFFPLLREALGRPDQRPDMLGAGLALLPALPRDEAIALLEERLSALEAARAALADQANAWSGPVHLQELLGLRLHAADNASAWTRGLIERLRGGAYVMAGEAGHAFGAPGGWPAPGRG
jgi:DNA-binding PadR family transcriptional regulator